MPAEVCEVWTDSELTALVLGTVGVSAAAFLGVILLCVRLAARPWPAGGHNDTSGAPFASERRTEPRGDPPTSSGPTGLERPR